jgi:hypothetical protein
METAPLAAPPAAAPAAAAATTAATNVPDASMKLSSSHKLYCFCRYKNYKNVF